LRGFAVSLNEWTGIARGGNALFESPEACFVERS